MPPQKKFLVDIYERTDSIPPLQRPKLRQKIRIYRKTSRRLIGAIVVLLILGAIAGFYTMRALAVRQFAASSIGAIYEKMQKAEDAFSNFDLKTAQTSFDAINADIDTIMLEAGKYGTLRVAPFLGIVIPPLRNVSETITALNGLAGGAMQASRLIEDIKYQIFPLIVNRQGGRLIEKFEALDAELATVAGHITTLHIESPKMGLPISEHLLSFQSEVAQDEKLIQAILHWFSSKTPHHLLLLLQNPNQMRPAGGVISAYGDLTISGGSLTDIAIHNLADISSSSITLIPPKPLQLLQKEWKLNDLNWFFNFPLSAKKIIETANSLPGPGNKQNLFDAVLTLNPSVINDILNPTDVTRALIQSEFDSGSLKVLTGLIPQMLQKIAALPPADQDNLFTTLAEKISNRDIMAYFADPEIQEYIRLRGGAGDIAQNQASDVTDYLAVVNANIGESKSDAGLRQAITLKSQINSAGEISNALTVSRRAEKTNRNYFQIYTPLKSAISSASGAASWPAILKYDYSNFQTDPDINAIAQTRKFLGAWNLEQFTDAGKTVFAGWLTTPAKESRSVTLQYLNTADISEHKIYAYTFIADMQSGVDSSFSFTVAAPPAYKWKESNSPQYEFKTDHASGRIVINLTLLPI